MTYCFLFGCHFTMSSTKRQTKHHVITFPTLYSITWHSIDQEHPIKTRFFPKIRPVTKSTTHQSWMPWQLSSPWLCHHQIPPPIHFPALPLAIELHWPPFLHSHWPSRFVAYYKFTTATYHSKFIILHALRQQNHPVYRLNLALFYYKLLHHLVLPYI